MEDKADIRNSEDFLIRVTGKGSVTAKPDSATVVLGVAIESQNLVEGQQQNARLAGLVIQSLKSLGIPPENIRTFDYRVDTQYDFKDGKQIFRAYKVTHLFQVTITNLENTGQIVDTAVKNGANYVSDIRFTLNREEEIYNQALAKAMENALNKAQIIAETIQVKLNPVPIKVLEGLNRAQPFPEQLVPMVKSAESTPIQPGQIAVNAEIVADYRYSVL